MRDIDIQEQFAAVHKHGRRAELIAFKRLPASQRLIIEREGKRIKALMLKRKAENGNENGTGKVVVSFGPVSQRELMAKLGRWMIVNEVFEIMGWNEVE